MRHSVRACAVDGLADGHALGRALPARARAAARRRQLARARDARDRPRPALHRARRGRRADRRRRQPLRRLRLLVGAADPRPRAPGTCSRRSRGAAAAGHELRRADAPARSSSPSEVVRRMEGVEMLRMTSSGTEASMTAIRLARAATGREHDRQVRRRLPRPRRRAARAGRLGPRHAGAAREPRRAGERGRGARSSCPGTTPRR